MELLETEIAFREEIIDILQKRKSVRLSTGGTATEIGHIEKAIKSCELGDYSNPTVSKVVKELRQKAKITKKQSERTTSELTIDEIITRYNFHMSAADSSVWFYQSEHADKFGNRRWISVKKDALQANFAATDVYIRGGEGVEDYSSFKIFNKKLVDQNRTYTKICQSYRPQPAGVLNTINKNFCAAEATGATDYHWIFDAVLETISGADSTEHEAFDTMQRTIWCKYLHPENLFIPNPVVRDPDGRGGKGLTSGTFLTTLFGGNIADNCSSDHVIGKFNGVIAGKAVVIVNETNRDKIEGEKIKSFLGSLAILVENKFQTPYYADNTSLVFFFTNELSGGITLNGTSSDLRFSFFNIKNTIYTTCQKYFKQYENLDLTTEQVKDWIEGTDADSGQMLLQNTEQVGSWINAMHKKFGDITNVKPLHGAEYRLLKDRQRGAWTRTVEEVFTDTDFEYIRTDLLSDLIREYNRGEVLPGRNKMKEEIEKLIKDKNLPVEYQQRAQLTLNHLTGNRVQRSIWRIKKSQFEPQRSLMWNDDAYGKTENSRWIWTWNTNQI